jgi:Ser/Thr protein kinase RdoA (MazF antagonist)
MRMCTTASTRDLQTAVFGASMTTAVAQTPLAEVEAAVRQHYGFHAVASRLHSERDELFLIDAGAGVKYVLRFANPADDRSVIDMQARALEWIANTDRALPVPRLIPRQQGGTQWLFGEGAAAQRLARLSSYLAGRPLAGAPRSARQRRAIGTLLARLGRALQDFSHPGADHALAWDIQHASSLHELVPSADAAGPAQRWDLVRRGLERFETIVKPRLPELRAQVVHADFNPHNLLVDPEDPDNISGILDFGDMVRTPLINDVAIAACYHAASDYPLADVADIVSAYHAVTPLLRREIGLLHDLIVTRLCAAVTITEWRARRYPHNRDYILKNTTVAWTALERLSAVEPSAAAATLYQVCQAE